MGFGKDQKGTIVYETRSQSLGTLGAGTSIIVGTKLAITDGYRMLKSQVKAVIDGLTATESKGFSFYLAHGDLSITEIDEAIELNGPLGRQAVVETERSMRPVFLVGAAGQQHPSALEAVILDLMTGAPVCTTKPRWTWDKDTGWNWVVRNTSGSNLTTGATCRLEAKSWGIWLE